VSGCKVERSTHGPFRRLSFLRGTPMGVAQMSVYRVGDTLIDTGGTPVGPDLVAALADDPPRRIVLTHQHEDHVGNVPLLRRHFGHLPVFAPRPHLDIIAGTSRVPDYRAFFWGHPEPSTDLIGYDPGEAFETGDTVVEAVLTPGHTPHHIAFVANVGGVAYALTGDLYTSKPLEAWYESAAYDMATSLRRLLPKGSAPLSVLPTHGRVKEDGVTLLRDAADWLDREAERVETAAASGPSSHRALAKALYDHLGPDIADAYSGGEISRAAFVRSVLEPVRSLPATLPT
jgi:glyoxylase-like metal-dependent hydrolase (beta-lactamase superfamily II)